MGDLSSPYNLDFHLNIDHTGSVFFRNSKAVNALLEVVCTV